MRDKKQIWPNTLPMSLQGTLIGGGLVGFKYYRYGRYGITTKAAKISAGLGILGLAYTGYQLYNSLRADAINGDGIELIKGYSIGRNTVMTTSAALFGLGVAAFQLAGPVKQSVIVGAGQGTFGVWLIAPLSGFIYDGVKESYHDYKRNGLFY
jgi:hypothetical protein